ncbi:GH1 family beta-glucosidase [Actinotalea sp. JY-7876]|uniref:GH1 family beta-glucosidase n=1 Tax=Actinotalea sp. JY-7876 TaxID=2758442 RepID=UPI0015F674DE|nr:GH1 family beta-glucosidase [Actinotalea sp. JY-7876]
MNHDLKLPRGFVWGAATAAFQIEGASTADGRTDSIWDTFCRVPGAVANGDTGEVACDHYHRWPQDIALMTELGLGAYRFSTAWPRIMPEPGRVEQRGIDFYSRLVDGLLEAGVTPWLTLYHWDMPQWLEDRGGWTSREVVDHFTEYSMVLHSALGDRVRQWTTLNEPWCSAFLGYAGGQHAPGRQEPQAAVSTAHHLLLAHGHVIREIRAVDPTASLGITLNFTVTDPVDPSDEADVRAAALVETMQNRLFVEPVVLGAYPQDAVDAFAAVGTELPVRDGDLEVIATPIDFLGVNYYNGMAITGHQPAPETVVPAGAPPERTVSNPSVGVVGAYPVARGLPRTAMDWEVQPDGLERLLIGLHKDYTGPAGIPLYVTENGSAFEDEVGPDGTVHDVERTDYLVEHLAALGRAVEAGADVRGYFAWSLLDNFEWAFGYDKRFGIVHVDFETLERTPKTSARVYASAIATGTVPLGGTVRP